MAREHSADRALSGITGALDEVQLGDVGACALHGGQRICWGYDYWGGVGDGQYLGANSPAEAPFLGPTSEGGGLHGCALASDGTLACWGLGVHGQVGDGSHGSNVPVMLPPPP